MAISCRAATRWPLSDSFLWPHACSTTSKSFCSNPMRVEAAAVSIKPCKCICVLEWRRQTAREDGFPSPIMFFDPVDSTKTLLTHHTSSSTQDDDDGGDDDWGWDETPRTTRSSGSADLEMAQVKRKDSDDFSWNDDVGISSSSISDQPKASPVPPQSKRLQHRSRPSPPTRQAMPQTTPPAVSLERHHPLSSAISPTSSSSLPVAQPITQLGPSRKPAPKKKAPAAPRKEDDFFSEMGLSAKPTFAKKTPGSAKKVKKAAPAVSLALDDDDFGDDADWGDDADLDDLLG